MLTTSDFPEIRQLENGFVVHYPNGPVFYRANSESLKVEFLYKFGEACAQQSAMHEGNLRALKQVYG